MASIIERGNYDDSMHPKLVNITKQIENGSKLTSVDLTNCGLISVPRVLFEICDSLEVLNLGNNNISDVPDDMNLFVKLRVLFFGQNRFKHIPIVLGTMPSLFMLSFKSNQIEEVHHDSLSPSIGWLILTDNKIASLPTSIGHLRGLRKLMLAGNLLVDLPLELSNCLELELIRLSCNKLASLPHWLVTLPKLSWLAFSGNPCAHHLAEFASDIPSFTWKDLRLGSKLGEGASGSVYKATCLNTLAKADGESSHRDSNVAVKIFKGDATSDGCPEDEMKMCLAAGEHPCLVAPLAKFLRAESSEESIELPIQSNMALLFPLIDESKVIIGQPPSFASVTRDAFAKSSRFHPHAAFSILHGIASALQHLHERGICHGDLYAHNIMLNDQFATSLYPLFPADSSEFTTNSSSYCKYLPTLCDFGAASTFSAEQEWGQYIPIIEIRAFGCLIDDIVSRLAVEDICASIRDVKEYQSDLLILRDECMYENVDRRPSIQDILIRLRAIQAAHHIYDN